jgi:hypothetical protein
MQQRCADPSSRLERMSRPAESLASVPRDREPRVSQGKGVMRRVICLVICPVSGFGIVQAERLGAKEVGYLLSGSGRPDMPRARDIAFLPLERVAARLNRFWPVRAHFFPGFESASSETDEYKNRLLDHTCSKRRMGRCWQTEVKDHDQIDSGRGILFMIKRKRSSRSSSTIENPRLHLVSTYHVFAALSPYLQWGFCLSLVVASRFAANNLHLRISKSGSTSTHSTQTQMERVGHIGTSASPSTVLELIVMVCVCVNRCWGISNLDSV